MKIKAVFPLLGFFLLCFTCNNKQIKEESKYFNITNPFSQKITPGQEGQEVNYAIGFTTTILQSDIKFDSIYYKGKIADRFKISGNNFYTKTSRSSTLDIPELKNNNAILFYTHKEKQLYCYITEILKKKDIYLP